MYQAANPRDTSPSAPSARSSPDARGEWTGPLQRDGIGAPDCRVPERCGLSSFLARSGHRCLSSTASAETLCPQRRTAPATREGACSQPTSPSVHSRSNRSTRRRTCASMGTATIDRTSSSCSRAASRRRRREAARPNDATQARSATRRPVTVTTSASPIVPAAAWWSSSMNRATGRGSRRDVCIFRSARSRDPSRG